MSGRLRKYTAAVIVIIMVFTVGGAGSAVGTAGNVAAGAAGAGAAGAVGNVAGTAGAARSGTDGFRAVWVCSVINLDFPSRQGLGNAELKKEIDEIIKNARAMKLNALILQVRPSGDALYKSGFFPWSEYLTGVQGLAPADGFDPLEYWVAQAHANGLELHAWINPYRVTHTTAGITDVSKLANGNPAKTDPSRVVEYKGALYYDPGLYINKKLVINGVSEIIRKYDVDGIHLDDYFYPGADFGDDATYELYGRGIDKADWRRGNVNDIIRGIQRTVARYNHRYDKNVRFGVSPFAIWMNSSSSPLGSDTRGNESYKNMYADTRRWVKSGWLDYICPQIYWYRGFEIADYAKVLDWWADVCEGTRVDLYVGHAAYREADGANSEFWDGETVGQLMHNAKKHPDIVKGSIFFRYKSMLGDVGRQVSEYYSK